VLMLSILKFVDPKLAGLCFVGFAIGSRWGERAAGVRGIFTKIADVGSDMMKIVFRIKEDDARNPGVIADCAGDNAATAWGRRRTASRLYGVTGVALISFICLAVPLAANQWTLLVWIFSLFIAMVVFPSWRGGESALSRMLLEDKPDFQFRESR